MTLRFKTTWDDAAIVVALEEKGLLGTRAVPISGGTGNAGLVARRLLALTQEGRATVAAQSVSIPHAEAARLPGAFLGAIGVPGEGPIMLRLMMRGAIGDSDAVLQKQFTEGMTRVIQPRRTGLILAWGQSVCRLGETLFDVIEAADGFNATVGQPFEARAVAFLPVQRALARAGADVAADGFTKTLQLYQAGSFALDVVETPLGLDFTPILMGMSARTSLEDDNVGAWEGEAEVDSGPATSPEERVDTAAPLMPQELQKIFASDRFAKEGPVRLAYVLKSNTYVVLDATLARALDVVKAKRAAPQDERRAFAKNPRAALAAALGDGADDEALAALFVETRQYSDRVTELGIWEKPSLPWLARPVTQWLPESFPLDIGGATVTVTRPQAERIADEIAAKRGVPGATVMVGNMPVSVAEAESILQKAAVMSAGPSTSAEPPPQADPKPGPAQNPALTLLYKVNFEGVEYEVRPPPRPIAISKSVPTSLTTGITPKRHQAEGISWLISAFATGWPGVLLADDMGVGKTFQALMFLAWVRANRRGKDAQGGCPPLLIVAPTALLRNWEAEADRFLSPHALGKRVEVYGSKLKALKSDPAAAEGATLKLDELRGAGVVLTTYETLTIHADTFARVNFAVAVFDEIQKIKDASTLNWAAAVKVNADFALGMTGTPVENRIEDLWSIMDRLVPGLLGDLKSFSRTYARADREGLMELKARLEKPAGKTPVMMRRMKHEVLDGLPNKYEEAYKIDMPKAQADAYEAVVREGMAVRGSQGTSPGKMLEILHRMRGICLHPQGPSTPPPRNRAEFETWAAASARTAKTVELLRGFQVTGDKALVFVELRAMQDMMAEALVQLLGLSHTPPIIRGSTPGEKRIGIVDAFQKAPLGFAVLILSPKAAGVGLNITAASHVVHLSRWWNPAVEDQCNDRAYRLGQKRDVTVHLPLAVHPRLGPSSFDIKVHELLGQKRELSRGLLAPPLADGDTDAIFGATVGDAPTETRAQ
ncbi:Helicase conserved C-terminal domain-containing protein [Rhizobiales bacterium GAS113]|nr:Helicase conserved C-terminal domain-containing protein [Rhizobiales bacterium GAS113]